MGHEVKGKKIDETYVVVLIGGKGKRLRPLSTDAKPKAFLSVTRDRKTMFRRTVERALKVAPLGRIVPVANRDHLRHVTRDVPGLRKKNLLLEPVSRNTAPAIALAARFLRRQAGDAIMVVLPTDQYIADEAKYVAAVKKGVAFVRSHPDALIVLGHTPSYAATQFGYVRVGSGRGIRKVVSFKEKPGQKKAARYVSDGRHLWNTGAFIFRVSTILRQFRELAPAIYNGLERCERITRPCYAKLPDISIDYAIMERARNIYCVKGDYRWQDMGNFDALRGILKQEGRRFVERDGKIIRIV